MQVMYGRNSSRSRAAWHRLGLMAVLGLLLAGCSGSAHQDLEEYIENVRRNAHGVVPKLPEVKPYESVSYSAYSRRDPFTPYSEPDQEPPDTGSFGEGPRPDFNRKRETLEQFPLDTLKYVGHLEKGGVRWGLIQSGPPDETVYRVQVGNHIGQNYGEIVDISESQIKVVELIPNGKGGWIPREATLPLNE